MSFALFLINRIKNKLQDKTHLIFDISFIEQNVGLAKKFVGLRICWLYPNLRNVLSMTLNCI